MTALIIAILHYIICTAICYYLLKKQGFRTVNAFIWGLFGIIGILYCSVADSIEECLFPFYFKIK